MKSCLFAVIYASSLVLAFGLGWLAEFWDSPLGEPLCLARGADVLKSVQLQPDYRIYWAVMIGIVGIVFAGLLVWIGISLHRIAGKNLQVRS